MRIITRKHKIPSCEYKALVPESHVRTFHFSVQRNEKWGSGGRFGVTECTPYVEGKSCSTQ